jgi:polysaccharide deacetylase 2 family uncharacterized protein YibQ
MRRDELRQPLQRHGLASRLWSKRPSLLSVSYVTIAAAFIGASYWAVTKPMPFAGEPIVVVSIPPAKEVASTASTKPVEAETPAADTADTPLTEQDVAMTDPAGAEQVGEPEVTLPDPPQVDTYQNEAAIIVSPRRPLTPAPQAHITEKSPYGDLPTVSADGERASRVYERTTPTQVILSDQPKIALLIGGMGLNEKLTTKAIKDLPADITFAFAPYGENLQAQVNKARSEGHEVFLQVPMEPIGYPANNPGPKTLTGDGSEAENIDAMRWHMGRFSGYAGIVNYLGTRFLSMPKSVQPMLKEVKQRGLLFLEDGSMALSSLEIAAKAIHVPTKRAQVVIDADPNPQAIIAQLTLLEEQATGKGFAIGTGSGLEVTINTVREWSKAAAERGIILVPISASFKARNQ